MNSIELFQKGGPVMVLLLLCSLTVAAIAIERYRFYRVADGTGSSLMMLLRQFAATHEREALAGALTSERSAVAVLVHTALQAEEAHEDVASALEVSYEELAMELRERLNYLSMIVTMAPLLGLLGTISGMIQSFSIFNLQAGQPMAITGGIGEALIATATGLCVAIFALVVHTYFAQRMDIQLTRLEKAESLLRTGFAGMMKGDGGEADAA